MSAYLTLQFNNLTGETLQLPINGVNFTVDWGDGTLVQTNTSSHTYSSGGTGIVQITITSGKGQFGTGLDPSTGFPYPWQGNTLFNQVIGWGNTPTTGFSSYSAAFSGCTNLTSVPGDLPQGVTN
jgi:hypothetical protein